MDWNRFDPRGQDKSEAFEAFAGMLFERWCRREYAGRLREVRFVEGKGGDGGVEAYALLASGDVIGLQAKWFRDGLGDTQIRQINNSFTKATEVRPRIVRYCVALPKRLSDDRGLGQKTERDRWNGWLAKARVDAPGAEVELWDEVRLLEELSEPENEGLHAYWFTDSIISMADLKRRFEAAKAGWLRQRYIPDLHSIGRLEEDLALRLGAPAERARILDSVEKATSELSGLRDDVARLARLPSFQRDIPDAEELRRDAMEALARMVRTGQSLADALRRCVPPPEAQRPSERDEEPLRCLMGALSELERDRSFAPTSSIRERLDRCTKEAGQPPSVLRDAWACWSRASRLVAYVGSPGVGKTHGLAHAIEQRLARGQPARLLRARDCPVEDGWEAILRNALGRPNARLIELFNAMESTAARAEVHCARKRADQVEPHSSIEPEPGFFFIAIDGLEEPGKHRRWAERIGELSEHLSHHPRIRTAVALRAASCDEILGRVRSDLYDKVVLPEGGDVQLLLPKYCAYWGIALPDRRVRWAIRDPLSLRLYCELRSGSSSRSAWGLAPQDVSLPMLLREKLQRMEEELKEKSASNGPVPLREALTAIVEAYLERGALQRDDVIGLVRKAAPNDALTADDASWLLNQASEHGLLLVHVIEPEDAMARPVELVEPAIEPLIDYLIALKACSDAAAALQRGESPSLPQPLQLRHDALTQAAILLAQKRISLIRSGLWRDELSSETIERLELRAIAALDHDAARTYHDWVLERLRASMPSCRRVLAELCVPVARDTAHPFGPRYVHEALLPFLPAQRDQFWSSPRLLPGEGGQPWEGHGDAALETLALEADDPADGPPLLLAWALTSLDSQWRRKVRAKLASWGARHMDGLLCWLDIVLQTNDPQMAEDIAMVAYGAACLVSANPELAALVRWVDANLLESDAPFRRDDIIILNAARGIVERARAMGLEFDSDTIGRLQTLYKTTSDVLSIDVEAARNANDHHGVSPIMGDLAWYVVPEAVRGFFYNRKPHGQPDLRAHDLAAVSDEVLAAALGGKLGPLEADVRLTLEADVERRGKAKSPRSILAVLLMIEQGNYVEHRIPIGSEEGKHATDGGIPSGECAEIDEGSIDESPTSFRSDVEDSLGFDERAERVLDLHAKACGIDWLSPQRFAFAVLIHYLRAMGWNREEFKGGGPGERLGMDTMIVRMYDEATHGEKSGVATAAEKYVRTGCRLLQCYLACRVPWFSDDLHRDEDAPVDPMVITEDEPNPASDVVRAQAGDVSSWAFWASDDLVRSVELRSEDQADRALEWIDTAPEPPMLPWLLVPPTAAPSWAEDRDWVTLRCFVVGREQESQSESLLRIWAGVVCERTRPILERDVGLGLHAWRLDPRGFSEGIQGPVYVDPFDATWAPWCTGVEGEKNIATLDGIGRPMALGILAATAQLTWRSPEGERELWLPAFWMRHALGLTDVQRSADGAEWRFLDRHGKAQAIFSCRRVNGELREALLVRRHSLEQILSERGMSLIWSGWLFREPRAAIKISLPEERWPVHREWKWLATWRGEDVHFTYWPSATVGRATKSGSSTTSSCESASDSALPSGPGNPDLATPLTTDLDDDQAIPYFLWDDPMPVAEVRRRLATASPAERDRLLGKILREARDPDVWRFTSPSEVAARFSSLSRYLGRRLPFWRFLLNLWHKEGLLEHEPA